MKGFLAWLIAAGPIGIGALAVLDSAGIPLPAAVDFLMVGIGTAGLSSALLAATLAVIGSLAGNLILFSIARKGGEAYLSKHCLSPRARRFQRWFQHYGLLTVFIPALLPIPLPMKIFVISAGALGVSVRAFALACLAGRVPRYFGLAYIGMKVGEESGTWITRHALELSAVGVALFFALYAAIKYKDRVRAREAMERAGD